MNRAIFRPEEIDIQDNWHVSGLKATGSSDYVAEDVWLPADQLGSIERTKDYQHERLVRINTLFQHSEKYRHPWELP